jgi:citrate lyase subunit beta/citryl-CoA lyase
VSTEAPRPVRSALFVPANRRSWIDKVHVHGADTVVLDLEDATPEGRKAQARDVLKEMLPVLHERGQPAWVRVNALQRDQIDDDLDAACREGMEAICLPKVRVPEDVRALDRLLGYHEGRNGLPHGRISIYPLLETAEALLDPAPIFAASSRVRYAGAVAAPNADVEFAVGYRWSDSFVESLHLRSAALLAARAAGISNPITGLVTALDVDLVKRFAVHSRGLGYAGTFVIHPAHVGVVNHVFTPTDDEYAWSREVLDGFATVVEPDFGAVLGSDGLMIDQAMVRVAERISTTHELLTARDRRRGS